MIYPGKKTFSNRLKVGYSLNYCACACALMLLWADMALQEGALRAKLLFNSRHFYKCTSCIRVRSLSEKVTPKPVTGSSPETTGDHLIYTPEHFALKASLRKVCTDVSIAASFAVPWKKRYWLYFVTLILPLCPLVLAWKHQCGDCYSA